MPPQAMITVIAIFLLGGAQLLRRRAFLVERQKFTHEFQRYFVRFAESRGTDSESFVWVMKNMDRMQANLGVIGVLDGYRPAFANYIVRNYQILINTLPEIQTGHAHPDMIDSCQVAILRYIGTLDRWVADSNHQLVNPLVYLKEGVSTIISLPVYLLSALGLIAIESTERFRLSRFVQFLSICVVLVGLVGSIIGIVTGWDQFTKTLEQLHISPPPLIFPLHK